MTLPGGLEPPPAGPHEQRLLGEVTEMLREVTGEDARWAARVTSSSRLEADLRLDSLEVAALGDLLQQAHGGRVDLPSFLAGLDIDQIIALTVGDLVAYVANASEPRDAAVPGLRSEARREGAASERPEVSEQVSTASEPRDAGISV